MFLNRVKAFWRLSSVRQTLGLLVLFMAITLLAWGGTYWLVQREMYGAVYARLEMRMEAAKIALAAQRPLPVPADGQTARLISDNRPDGYLTTDPIGPGPEMRYLIQTTPHGRIMLGENTERQDELGDILSGGMLISLFGSLFAAVLAGLWMAQRGQKRLKFINDGLAKVAQGQLDTRIALEGDDDLSLLSARIDATTERLDHVMMQMQVQSTNIAHDLRTPLARLRALIETNLIALIEKKQAVTTEDLGAALEQIDNITGTFNALLRLARIESGAGRDAFSEINLGEIVKQVGETYAPLIEEAHQTLVLDIVGETEVYGDSDMLAQLITNLLLNAVSYGPNGQEVTIRVHGSRLSVSDEGSGIALPEREKVLQPFYQTEPTRQGPGVGLGLAMVRAISDLHEAALSFSDGPNGRGLTVTVAFPNLTKFSS